MNGELLQYLYTRAKEIYEVAPIVVVKPMSHIMKLWEREMEQRLRRETKISENQLVSCQGG